MNVSDRTAILWRVETDVPLRFWSGVGVLPVPVDGIETDGANYLGIGLLVDLPVLKMLSDGAADRLTLTLNGVDARLIELIDTGSEEVEGRDVHMAFADFDEHWQLDNVYWFENFELEKVEYDDPTSTDLRAAAARNPRIIFTLAYGDGDRRVPVARHWNAEGAAVGDLAFNLLAGLNDQSRREFPPPGK